MSVRVVPAAPTFSGVDASGVDAWRADLVARLGRGHRVVTLFGRPADVGTVRITAVFEEPGGALAVARVDLDPARGYPHLTGAFPALHVFERELHEQLGVAFRGHPWLKPLRFEHGGAPDAYPFYRVDGGQSHEVQVGPIHAGVIEPGAFRFAVEGEDVHHLEIHLGYQHRGVEALLLRRDPRALAPLVETVAGDTSVAHTWAYAAAIEALAGAAAGVETGAAAGVETGAAAHDTARALLLELERVAMHLAGLSGLAQDLGFAQGASTYGRLRTTAINATMRLCGSRFGRGGVRPGGSGVTLDPERRAALRDTLALLSRDATEIDARFLGSSTVLHRLQGTGRVPAAMARDLGLVGLAARASGLAIDRRAHDPRFAGLPVVTRPGGDCLARAEQRVHELHASLRFLGGLLANEPEAGVSRGTIGPLAPDTLAVSVVEGWRGEVVHALETDREGRLIHYKVQDPSLRNWMGLAQAVRGEEISDFPICNKSFDLSYCGSDL